MKPIRKNELEYYERLIDKKFEKQGDALNRQFNNEVDKKVEQTFKSFKKHLKVDDMIKQLDKARSEYETFKRTKDQKESELRDKLEKHANKLANYLREKSETNDWDLRISRYDRDDMISPDQFDEKIKEACRVEARRYLEKQDIAKNMKALETKKEMARNILFSGSSINSVVSELSHVFKASQIEFQIPKSLLQLEAPKDQ